MFSSVHDVFLLLVGHHWRGGAETCAVKTLLASCWVEAGVVVFAVIVLAAALTRDSEK